MPSVILKNVLQKGALKVVEWAIGGGVVTYMVIKTINGYDASIDERMDKKLNEHTSIILNDSKTKDSCTRAILVKIVDKIEAYDTSIYKDNRALRKENFQLWKENLNLKDEVKKNDLLLSSFSIKNNFQKN